MKLGNKTMIWNLLSLLGDKILPSERRLTKTGISSPSSNAEGESNIALGRVADKGRPYAIRSILWQGGNYSRIPYDRTTFFFGCCSTEWVKTNTFYNQSPLRLQEIKFIHKKQIIYNHRDNWYPSYTLDQKYLNYFYEHKRLSNMFDPKNHTCMCRFCSNNECNKRIKKREKNIVLVIFEEPLDVSTYEII